MEEVVDAATGPVAVRILAPTSGRPQGVYLDIHGGGFYMDSAAHSDARNRALAEAIDFAVVSVDYRLAPEHPWPAAPDDCEAVALWLMENAAARFGTSRLTIGGFSAGATLAMVTLLRLRNKGWNWWHYLQKVQSEWKRIRSRSLPQPHLSSLSR